MIRLAFLIHFNRTWLGGMNVILNLIKLILDNKKISSKIKILLITNSKKKLKKYKLNKSVEIIENKKIFNQNIFNKILDRVSIILTGKTIFLEKFFLKYKLDFISHSTIVTGKKSFTKTIIWLPDFQYLYFPNFFSIKYKILKNLNLKIYKNHSYKILLSSYNAKKDLKKICNVPNSKIIVNQFTFQVPNFKYLRKFSYLKKKYLLKKNFFYLPNQYWVHKNHRVVIEALKKIKTETNKNIFIYSSGSTEDYRNPQNFETLMSLVKEYKLQKNYIYLGVIPYIDVMSLIYHSKAILNPSYFEGWSSTVEQAKAYNKKIILSKINVHKEQNPKYSYYFKPNDYNGLSKMLIKLNSTEKKFLINQKDQIKIKKKIDDYVKKYCNIILKKI